MQPQPAPFVSVVIPVYGAAPDLGDCLDQLMAQTYPRDRYEVVVVDNGAPTLDAIVGGRDIVVLCEPRPGSYTARNAAIRETRGEILAFTDDDCLPDLDWIERGVAALADSAGIVAGGITIAPERPPGVRRATYAYSAIFSFRGNQDGVAFGATANLFVRREAFDRIGLFDETLFSGGDWAWGRSAHERGVPTHFDTSVHVYHQVRPTIRSIVRRELRIAGGAQTRRNRIDGGRKRFALVREIVHWEIVQRLPWAYHVLREPGANETPWVRTQVAGIVVLVHTLRTLERIRISFGGRARRA